MTKAEAKKLIKEYYREALEVLEEKIVDWNIWDDNGDYMYNIITISKNHVPYKYSGYFEGKEIHGLCEGSGLLTIAR